MDDVLSQASFLQPIRCLGEPLTADVAWSRGRVEQDQTRGRWRYTAVNEAERVSGRESIKPGHQIDISCGVTERPCGLEGRVGQIVGVGNWTVRRHRLTGHPTVQQRKFGIDAGNGAL